MKKSSTKGITPTRIAVDIGGTFTDIALDNGNRLYTAKTLTTQDDPVRGVIDVIRIAGADAGCTMQSIGSVIHGTTLATNALLERKGARVGKALGISGNQAAYGISQMVDESMSNAARVHAVEHGKEVSARTMIAFGGNGPLHATRVAEKIGVTRIIIPRNPAAGLISKKALRRVYSVCLKPDGTVDSPTTRELRRT
jgi:N-methylhydantoinase A/oxoprolinase/acetone carboxylase beta subunit